MSYGKESFSRWEEARGIWRNMAVELRTDSRLTA